MVQCIDCIACLEETTKQASAHGWAAVDASSRSAAGKVEDATDCHRHVHTTVSNEQEQVRGAATDLGLGGRQATVRALARPGREQRVRPVCRGRLGALLLRQQPLRWRAVSLALRVLLVCIRHRDGPAHDAKKAQSDFVPVQPAPDASVESPDIAKLSTASEALLPAYFSCSLL